MKSHRSAQACGRSSIMPRLDPLPATLGMLRLFAPTLMTSRIFEQICTVATTDVR